MARLSCGKKEEPTKVRRIHVEMQVVSPRRLKYELHSDEVQELEDLGHRVVEIGNLMRNRQKLYWVYKLRGDGKQSQ